MWKGAKRRYLNLRKLGAKHKEAAGFARTSKGYCLSAVALAKEGSARQVV